MSDTDRSAEVDEGAGSEAQDGARARLQLDLSGLLEERAGAHGLPRAALEEAIAEGAGLPARIELEREKTRHAYMDLERALEDAEAARAFADKARGRFARMVQCGIGGSTMGNRALHQALPGDREVVILDNVDPGRMREVAASDLTETLVHVVTKSGETAETLAQLAVLKARLEEAVGDRWREHLLFTTDPARGTLRRLAAEHGIESFSVPPALGGRFSVLSPVGLVSLAFAGRDPEAVVEGARAARARGLAPDSAALAYASAIRLCYERGLSNAVFWVYADRLQALSLWWQQLLAESLGKLRLAGGAGGGVGPLPVPALGATDQHSVLQLFMEGPRDKWVSFLEVTDLGEDVTIPDAFPGVEALAYLAGRSMGELLRAERRGTQHALVEAGCPACAWTLDGLTEASMGELLMTLMLSVTFAGYQMSVDPYDQPGVEAGKRATFALFGRPGYAGAETIEAALRPTWTR